MKTLTEIAALTELAKRLAEPPAIALIRAHLFPQQLAFIDDLAKFKVARCTRRAGKSVAGGSYLELEALATPDTNCLYTALTRRSAKNIMWKLLKQHNRKFKLGAKFNETELSVLYPNNSTIQCIGINDLAAAEALRGQAFKVIVLDESASYGQHFNYIIDEILTPCLLDMDGTLCMIGTPNAACKGPFFDADVGEQKNAYSQHHWTLFENPHVPNATSWLESYRKRKRWSTDNPIYQREWLGLWVRSLSSLVYRFDSEKNLGVRPENLGINWRYIMGVDLGYNDATAFVVLAYSESSPDLYVVDTFKKVNMLPSEVSDMVGVYNDKYKPSAIVCDTGGLGKAIVEEMRIRYPLTMKAAEKKNKFEYVELLNSDLFEGHIKIDPELRDLRDEVEMLQWDENRKKEDPRFENHLCDAFLYAWRESGHWGYKPPKPEVEMYSREWEKQEMEKLAKKLKEQHERPWWEQ